MDERLETKSRFGSFRGIASLLVLLIAGAVFLHLLLARTPGSFPVEAESQQLVEGIGEIVSTRRQALTAETEALVVGIAAAGEKAQSGQVLASLKSEALERALDTARRDQRQLSNQAKIARNELDSRRLDLLGRRAEIRHRAENQQRRVELIRPLMESGAISRFEFESERLKSGELEAQLTAVEEQLALIDRRMALAAEDSAEQVGAAAATIRELERDLEALSVRAPYAGRWAEVAVGVGERVAAGATLGKLIDDERIVFLAQFPERHLAILSEAHPVEISVGGRTVAGSVARINRAVSGGLFRAEIRLDVHPDWLDGQTGSYRIQLPPTEPRFWVSAELGVDAHSEAELWVERDGTRTRRTVHFGAQQGQRLRVLSGAVAGDRLSLTD